MNQSRITRPIILLLTICISVCYSYSSTLFFPNKALASEKTGVICEIFNLTAEPSDCDGNGQFYVEINFDVEDPGNTFSVTGNGNDYGDFEYSQLPITVGPLEGDGTTEYEFVITDNQDPNCSEFTVIDPVDCNVGACEIWDLVVDPLDCNNDGTYDLVINFNYVNSTNDLFDVYDAQNNIIGTYALADLPVTHLNFVPSGNDFDFLQVCINDNNDCCASAEWLAPDCSPPCELSNLNIIPTDCDGEFFSVIIDFDYVNTSGSFSVVGNGMDYGDFQYAQLPIMIGPLEGDGTTVYEFIITDNEFGDCTIAGEIPPIDCVPPMCEIGAINFEPACDGDIAYAIIDFDYANTSNTFDLTINNDFYTFEYSQLPVVISPLPDNGNTYMLVTVVDSENNMCINETDHPGIECVQEVCEIWDLVVDPLECDNDGNYSILINFNYANPGNDFFDLIDANGNNIGFYALADLPVTHTGFVPSGNDFDVVTVCINDNNDCCATTEFEALNCGGGNCEIWDIVAEATDCDGELFNVHIDFNFANTSDSFNIVGNGNDYGNFAYTDLFIQLGPFEGNGQVLEFIVTDLEFGDCSAEVVLEAPVCGGGNCEIWDLVVDPLECDNDGNYSILINFNYANPGNDFFDLIDANGNNIGFYALADLPVTHTGFVPSGNNFDVVTVCINDNNDCCATTEFEALNCGGGNCEIWDIVAEATDCDGELFNVHIDFNFANTSDSFNIVGNGNDYGNFAYSDLFIELGPFEGNGQVLEFIVTDLEFGDCSAEVVLEAPVCGGGNCEIWDLIVDPLECDNDGNYSILINFNYANPGNDFFDLIDANGNNIGFYALADLPVTHTGFVPSGNNFDVVTVCINDNNDCCATTEFEALNCGGGNCEIWDIVAEATDCDGELFNVHIDFNFANTSDSFNIVGNGNDYGNFAYTDLFIQLGPFEGNGQVLEFIVTDLEFGDCSAEVVLEAPVCGGGNCEIWDLVVDPLECDNDGNYSILINFNYANPGNDFFDLIDANGNNIGFYALADLPVTHTGFVPSGNNFDVVTVCINDNNDCCATTEFEALNCGGGNCEIWDIVAEATDCDGELFNVHIDFNFANTSDSFNIVGNGNDYGNFAYSDLFIELGPFEGNGQVLEFIVTDLEFGDCSAEVVLEAPVCGGGNCEIWDLVVDPLECDNDGNYSILINFNYANPGNDFFDLIDANGNNIGFYALADLPVTHTGFVPSGNDFDVVTVCINDNNDCCATTEFEALNCGGGNCEIWDIVAEATDCDGELFNVHIDFNFANTSDSFNIVGNGNDYGNFAYSDLFIQLGPFEGNGQVLEFIVTDLEFGDCSAEVVLEAPVCGGGICEIWDLIVDPLECDNDGNYSILINFNYANPGNDFFDLIDANGNNIGFYALADLPVTHTGFVPSGNDFDVVTVCINDNNDCCATAEFEALNCGSGNCEIWDIVAEATDCDGELFNVHIDFNFANTSDSFNIVGNGNDYGNFAYSDLFIELGPFEGNGQVLEFIVTDLEFGDCSAEVVLEAPVCGGGNCEIWDLVVDPLECDNDGNYSILINFNYANPGNDFFDLIDANGNNIGFYALADLPVTHSGFVPSGNNFDVVTVCINDMPNCCATTEFEALDCGGGNCEIWDVIVEAYDCDDNDQFLVDLDFNFANTSDSFTVDANGVDYGTFAYDDLYITLGPFDGNGGVLVFTITDQENQDCLVLYTIEAPNCGGGNCEIWDLVVDPLECNNDGTYDIVINFNYANPGNDFFDLIDANGNNIGFYALADLPVTHSGFVPSGNNFDVVTVCINDMPNCCATTEFEALDCGGGNCEIWDVIVEAYDCDDNDQFLVDLDFNYANTSDSFTVDANGVDYGTFAYDDLYITLGPFDGNGDVLVFTITDQENPNCLVLYTIEVPNCGSGNCEIWDLEVDPQDCDDDGNYDIIINFEYANPGNDFFDVFDENGNIIGTYLLADLPVTHPDFVPSGNDFDVITVCINDNDNCCATIEFEAPGCTQNSDCVIENVVIEAFCDGDALFAEISFDYNGNGSDQFQILSCAPIGIFEYNQNGTYIIEIPGDLVNCAGGDVIPIGIFDLDNMTCGEAEFLEIPDCYNTGCMIEELQVEVSDCNDSEFFVTIDFGYENVGDNGFSVQGNGNDYGDFEYADLPITIGPLQGNGDEYEFIVFDNDDDNCWNFAEITAPWCVAPAETCIEFEGLTNGINYGGSNSEPGDLLMIENEVLVTLEGVTDPGGNLNYDYMFATTQDICEPFDAAEDNRLFMFNGLRFDFSPLTENPSLVTFPYHSCGIPFAISVNDQQELTYLLPEEDMTFNLSPNVVAIIEVNDDDPEEGVITLQGFVESLFVGGVEFQIDNVCFNVENLLPDVWPGDANFDNTSNHFDLLNVGIAYGFEGPERSEINIDWSAMPADDWDETYADNETNFKHADCDGDGIVEYADRSAILENYDLSHGPTPIFVQYPGTEEDPPFYVDLPSANDLEVGVEFSAPIILGTQEVPVNQIYGIAFTVNFDPEVMDEESVAIELGDSWIGVDGESLIHLNKKFAPEGIIEAVITRINQDDVGGFGPVGSFIGIIDDILGKEELEVSITDVKAIRLNEARVPLYTPKVVVDLSTTTAPIPVGGDINIFPNPAIDIINIDNQTGERILKIDIYNALGQLVKSIEDPDNNEVITISGWAAGIYFVKAEMESETVTKRIKKATP